MGLTGNLGREAALPSRARRRPISTAQPATATASALSGESPRRLPVNPKRAEGQWLARCEQSVRAIDALARSAPRGPVAERCRSIAGNAAISIEEIRRIAGRATQVESMLERIDANRLVAEGALLGADVDTAGSESLKAQQEVHRRLTAAGANAFARVRTASVGLDALVARMAEIVALADEGMPAAAGMAADNLGQLAQEMESLRAGLAESNSELMGMN